MSDLIEGLVNKYIFSRISLKNLIGFRVHNYNSNKNVYDCS